MNMHEIMKIVETGRWIGGESPIVGQFRYNDPKICVITGPNTSGKSLLRKIFHSRYDDKGIEFIHLSQAGRCEGGIKSAMIYGSERDESTGCNSLKTVLTAITTGIRREKPFVLFFDEPEIGCSDELSDGMAIRLIANLDKMKNLVGCMIVSHSRTFLGRFVNLNPSHIHLDKDYMSLSDWVNREIVPITDLEGLKDAGFKKWSAIDKLLKKK